MTFSLNPQSEQKPCQRHLVIVMVYICGTASQKTWGQKKVFIIYKRKLNKYGLVLYLTAFIYTFAFIYTEKNKIPATCVTHKVQSHSFTSTVSIHQRQKGEQIHKIGPPCSPHSVKQCIYLVERHRRSLFQKDFFPENMINELTTINLHQSSLFSSKANKCAFSWKC